MKKIFRLPALLMLVFLPFGGQACIHTYHSIPGVDIDPSQFSLLYEKTQINEERVRRFIQENTPQGGLITLTAADVVAAHLYLKEYDEAYALSTKLLKDYPQNYGVLMNHAWVLELKGNYKEALKYLKQAIAIEPTGHNASEWIHQILLENRIAGKTKPKRSILGLDFGQDTIPAVEDSLMRADLQYQLSYQINSRLFFAKRPDALFASLIFDYANIRFPYNYNVFENYALADDYGCADPLLAGRLQHAMGMAQETEQQMADLQKQMDFQGSLQYTPQRSPWLLFIKIGGIAISLILGIVKLTQKRNG